MQVAPSKLSSLFLFSAFRAGATPRLALRLRSADQGAPASGVNRLVGAAGLILLSLWVSGCASLPDNVERPVSTALANPATTRLGQAVATRAARAGTRNDSGFALVSTSELAFTSRMTLIKEAQKTLDIQYYAIFADDTTERMFDALREAAARGVRIRILLDDFNTSGKNAQVLKLAFENNMEMRLFNPLPGGRGSMFFRILGNLKDIDRMQRRMHNKIFIADNAVAITGGRNLGETYFGQSAGTNFVDIDLLAAGRMARDLSRSFDQYWNNPQAYPVQSLLTARQIEVLKATPVERPVARPDAVAGLSANAEGAVMPVGVASPATDGPAVTASTSTRVERVVTAPDGTTTTLPALPDDTDLRLLKWTWAPSTMLVDKPSKILADADAVQEAQDTAVDGLLQLMSQARSDLLIVSPYFVPGERMMKLLADIRKRGVRVRVLTNSLASNDAPAAHVGYARYRKALLAAGIELHEMRAEQPGSVSNLASLGSTGSATGGSRASLHAKMVVMDGSLIVVGSMNLDLRSQLQNSEVAIVVRNRALAAEATRLIEPALARGAYRVELQNGQLIWRAPEGSDLTDAGTDPDASVGLRLLSKLLGPFAPDEML
ncbi:MAG: phospholipase [Polaromonas sp. 39-63-203]|jgi:phosphatidylserine/phosphatidylglycerophosphate/cardiolipin synthase-like enzyme|uniref:phospholipase D family protein n=1 Tax=Polaromonas sp. TaxID=1869339 RepID=UPI000BCD0715|nr:phospholipase D family protein [Polaromonas sp.]OYY52984.1 MAG: phospholipase [Polaromonas sp. 35-63-240]OYZ83825.1 MAG: phospholipase [Polaromonas sp. 24-62-144]OZA99090.1 MAG: phospholipase [Polaromonas sp. 39-63-203]HQS31637.1 phospholipase D family protein [Polaromonas sp.]HQS90800.1 phospholipase D family protein [Polaromonas sp.]